jgi:two-component system, OmpR family, heavy metal sensor histidine kinase CusS
MRSLRGILILGTTIATALVLAVAGCLLYALARASLIEQMDRGLIDRARLIASGMESRCGSVNDKSTPVRLGDEVLASGDYMQVWQGNGKVLFQSSSLVKDGLEEFGGTPKSPECRWVSLPGGKTGRAVGVRFRASSCGCDTCSIISPCGCKTNSASNGDGEKTKSGTDKPLVITTIGVTLVLARDAEYVHSTLADLRTLLLLVGGAAIAASAGVLLLIIRRGLQPLDRLAAAISEIGEQDLHERINVASAPRELKPVGDRLNELLGRLETAFERERSFSADIAHELRTPLAGLRTTIDVTLARMRSSGEYHKALNDCLLITSQMHAMVENLLSLARLESGQVALQMRPLTLSELIREHWEPLASLGEARKMRLQWDLDGDRPFVSDPTQLGLMIHNVLDNAVSHGEAGGQVSVVGRVGENEAMVSVANTGSAVSQDQVENIFKRFWRGDAARTETGIHCGLGLALTKRIATLLGGTIRVTSALGGRFEITITVPNQARTNGEHVKRQDYDKVKISL